MSYELFYGSGGHGGPYPSLLAATKRAAKMLKGSRSETKIDVRERSATGVGGYGKVVARVVKEYGSGRVGLERNRNWASARGGDKVVASELASWIDVHTSLQPYYDNAKRRLAKGTYQSGLASKLFTLAANAQYKRYAKDQGMSPNDVSVATRKMAGEILKRQFEESQGVRGNPGVVKDKWIPTHATRFNSDGSVSLMGEVGGERLANGSRQKRARQEVREYKKGTRRHYSKSTLRVLDGRIERRHPIGNPRVKGVKFVLTKLRINSSGYEASSRPGGGQYYGVGAPVYHYEDYETGDISGEFRAYDRQDAIAKLGQIVANKI